MCRKWFTQLGECCLNVECPSIFYCLLIYFFFEIVYEVGYSMKYSSVTKYGTSELQTNCSLHQRRNTIDSTTVHYLRPKEARRRQNSQSACWFGSSNCKERSLSLCCHNSSVCPLCRITPRNECGRVTSFIELDFFWWGCVNFPVSIRLQSTGCSSNPIKVLV